MRTAFIPYERRRPGNLDAESASAPGAAVRIDLRVDALHPAVTDFADHRTGADAGVARGLLGPRLRGRLEFGHFLELQGLFVVGEEDLVLHSLPGVGVFARR